MRKLIIFLSLILISNSLISQNNKEIKIIEKPIEYNQERTRLSVEYLKERHGIIQTKPTITPKIIVLHYTAGGTIKTNFNYFNNIKIENARKINKDQSLLNVSAHYLIDRDGTIYHLVDDNLLARHTIGLNYCSIGVENIGSKKEPLTDKQVIANANLIRHLCKKHKIEYVIGHSEYIKFRKTALWKETNPNYITYKEDPGNQFLIDVRKLITDLNLKSKPK
jgi:N-acetyl-anhydromuramyl-L-alanine amidase AmpD